MRTTHPCAPWAVRLAPEGIEIPIGRQRRRNFGHGDAPLALGKVLEEIGLEEIVFDRVLESVVLGAARPELGALELGEPGIIDRREQLERPLGAQKGDSSGVQLSSRLSQITSVSQEKRIHSLRETSKRDDHPESGDPQDSIHLSS